MSAIVVPKLGLTIEEVEVIEWHISVGSSVESGQALVSVNADKTEVEIEAETAGSLSAISAGPGQIVKVGDVLGYLDDGIEPIHEHQQPQAPSKSVASLQGPTSSPTNAVAGPIPVEQTVDRGGRLLSSPLARRLARERQVNLREVLGTGPGGRIIARDVPLSATAPSQSPKSLRAAVDVAEAIGLLHTAQAKAADISMSQILVWAWMAAADGVILPPHVIGLARQLDYSDIGVVTKPEQFSILEVTSAMALPRPSEAGPSPVFALFELSEPASSGIVAPLPSNVAAVAAVGPVQKTAVKRHGKTVERPRVAIELIFDPNQIKGTIAGDLLRSFASQLSTAGTLLAELDVI